MNKEERTMGRQYNYYIIPEEELEFTKNLMDKGYVILETQKTSIDDKDIWKWKILSLEDIMDGDKCSLPWRTYIYKEEWGELKNYQEDYFDLQQACPVIEHKHCRIGRNYNELASGRFWIDTYYKEEMESFDTVYREFRSLVYMMKKRIVCKEYTFKDGRRAFWPISQKAIDLIEKEGLRTVT